jgi:hypothetical protein
MWGIHLDPFKLTAVDETNLAAAPWQITRNPSPLYAGSLRLCLPLLTLAAI